MKRKHQLLEHEETQFALEGVTCASCQPYFVCGVHFSSGATHQHNLLHRLCERGDFRNVRWHGGCKQYFGHARAHEAQASQGGWIHWILPCTETFQVGGTVWECHSMVRVRDVLGTPLISLLKDEPSMLLCSWQVGPTCDRLSSTAH